MALCMGTPILATSWPGQLLIKVRLPTHALTTFRLVCVYSPLTPSLVHCLLNLYILDYNLTLTRLLTHALSVQANCKVEA